MLKGLGKFLDIDYDVELIKYVPVPIFEWDW